MSSVQEVNDGNFQKEVLESPVPVLVDFWAAWCNPCRMMAPVIDAIAAKFSPKLKVVKLNTENSMKTPSDYSIQGIPSLKK